MIEKNEIKLNFHQFDSPFQDFLEEKLLFTFLNNRKKDLEKSGIKNLYSILSTKYNTVDHAVSTTLKHKTVFEKIEEISNRSPIIPIKNNRCFKKSLFSKIKSSFSKSRMFNSTDNINQITWLNGTTPIPKADIEAKMVEVQADYDAKQYQRDRVYPSIGDQLDMQYKDLLNGTTTWKDAVAKVKSDNPKD